MRKLFLFFTAVLLSVYGIGQYNTSVNVVEVNEGLLIIDSIRIEKGTEIQILVPSYGEDFLFIMRKPSVLSAGFISEVADIVGSGAAAVGIGSDNIGVKKGAIDVLRGAEAVKYGADALDKVDQLNLSKQAKKIVGKEFVVSDWEYDEGIGYTLKGKIGKKQYLIQVESAYEYGEIQLR